MTFRFTLFNDTDSIEINQPDGWRDAIVKLDRDENFHSLVQFFEGAFIFYGSNDHVDGGFHFIKQSEIDFGPDADLRALIEIAPDDETYTTLHDGQFKLSDLEEMPDNKIKVPIIRDDFWAKFISRLDTAVNLQSTTDLDNNSISPAEAISLLLLSQKVRKRFYATSEDEPSVVGAIAVDGFDIPPGEYGIIDWPVEEQSEVTQIFHYPIVDSPTRPFEKLSVEFAGTYFFDIQIPANYIIEYTFVPADIDIVFQKNNETPILFTRTNEGTDGVDGTTYFRYSTTIDLKVNDEIRVYAINNHATSTIEVRFYRYSIFQMYIEIIADTLYPESTAPSFLLHDVAGAIIDRITGTQERFYSEFLGSEKTLYKQYDEDGCQWTNVLARGLQLRQYTLSEKPFSISFKKWWDGANPVLNLGLGYEEVNGEQVIRVEEKEHFYNQSSGTSYDFSNVRDIVRTYNNDRIFNKVEIGYARWESEDISGIDDPQSRRTYASRFKKIGQTITLLSEFIAASLAIETTRRTTREKSADYKYDNEIFLISINPTEVEESPATSPDVVTFQPELDENFISVTGLLNAETRYNIRHSVAHMFIRWKSYLQGCLQSYIGSLFKFTSGQGNFDMASTMDLDCDVAYNSGTEVVEDQDFTVDDEIFHLCNLYEFTAPLEYEDFESIVANRKLPVGLSQTSTDHVPMFIKSLSYKVAHGEVTVQAWPIEFFDIQVQSDAVAIQECFPAAGACEDGITDNNGIQIVDENGICITA